MPDETTGSHGDPARSADGWVLTAQAGARSSLRTGAPLSPHTVISCGRHAQRLSRGAAVLTARCSFPAPLQGDTARARGTLALSPHAACSLTAALFQSPPGRAQMQDEQTVQGGTEGMVPGASKGDHTCRGSAAPSRT